MNNITAIIQARCNSSRLPNKILKKICNKELILHIIERISKCKNVKDIIIATTTKNNDDGLYDICKKHSIKCYRGSENNVLDRFYQAAFLSNSNIIIRITGDCPLIDPEIIDDMITNFFKEKKTYYTMEYDSNSTFPDGFSVEIFTFDSLKEAYNNATSKYDIEHVTPYIVKKYYDNKTPYLIYKKQIKELKKQFQNINFDKLHLSVDTLQEFNVVSAIFENIYNKNKNFTLMDVLTFVNNNPNILNKKEIDIFNGEGQKLYKTAKQIIPGGTQLLSKRPELFLPDFWPAYYKKANGIEVVTMDNIKFKDFSYMGIGACILGYCDPYVNKKVHKSVDNGNMTTLNCPSEVKLTKLMLELHKWADMARYTRSSGEACCMSIRIARAAANKDKVAFCGYHGWHDWYLATNLNNGKELDEHLLKGLNPAGVPKGLKNTAFPFRYNKINELENIISKHDIGTVIMETQRSEPPKNNFLKKVRELCDKNNIILIFDEVSAGFRLNTGGLHLVHNVIPDMAVFGKSLGNGYPIACVIGKKKYMDKAQNTFISSTFFTEDIGFVSAIAMIKQHRKYNVGEHIKNLGNYFQKQLRKISIDTNINITVAGLPCFSSWSFDYENGNAIKTLYIQKMLERKILAKNSFYLSYAHKKEDVDYYLKNIKEVFIELHFLIKKNEIEKNLLGPCAHNGFTRLA